jgi:hypothetical protein
MVGLSSEPETRVLLGDTGIEAGIPTTRLGLPYFDTAMPANVTAQVQLVTGYGPVHPPDTIL